MFDQPLAQVERANLLQTVETSLQEPPDEPVRLQGVPVDDPQ